MVELSSYGSSGCPDEWHIGLPNMYTSLSIIMVNTLGHIMGNGCRVCVMRAGAMYVGIRSDFHYVSVIFGGRSSSAESNFNSIALACGHRHLYRYHGFVIAAGELYFRQYP